MTTSQCDESFAATAVRKTFANLTSASRFVYTDVELEVSARDQEEVMRQLPNGVICFQFYERLIVDIEVDGEIVKVRSDRLNLSAARYFVDVDRMYERDQTFGWWKSNLYQMLREMIDEDGVRYAVTWRKPFEMMTFRPGVDVLLSR